MKCSSGGLQRKWAPLRGVKFPPVPRLHSLREGLLGLKRQSNRPRLVGGANNKKRNYMLSEFLILVLVSYEFDFYDTHRHSRHWIRMETRMETAACLIYYASFLKIKLLLAYMKKNHSRIPNPTNLAIRYRWKTGNTARKIMRKSKNSEPYKV